MFQLLERADRVRREVSPTLGLKRKSALGQFMTSASVARFMAEMFPDSSRDKCRLLDAGAGLGALSCAFLDRWAAGGFRFTSVEADAYEIDETLRKHLAATLASYSETLDLTIAISDRDFIEHAARLCLDGRGILKNGLEGFSHAILNPPYRKINTMSVHRQTLHKVGIETVNLYSAFVALALELMAPGGQLVAIVPRSFCNGPYYRPFRDLIFKQSAIRAMHLFDSRSKAFKDDDVLQENIIIRLERDGQQGEVTVSTSTDDSFSDLVTKTHPFNRIVIPGDVERFIHVPTSTDLNAVETSAAVNCSLVDLGVNVSTGPVVEFRLREHLRELPEPGTVPLLYPGHFGGSGLTWPSVGIRKPNAIVRSGETEKWLYPSGFYCVVRRFSSKEERRRIVASVVRPSAFDDAEMLGFENHLNVYHHGRNGLPEVMAHGLAAYLNTNAVDENFRRSSGHTQVNATDLKIMKYPSRGALISLGTWAMEQRELTQEMLDKQFSALTE